ncbi:hypothetical protein DVH05_011853 [Phytophthora capsici]|nr:hypothetical protein DVH05_011853 [Phytophthora capsici]
MSDAVAELPEPRVPAREGALDLGNHQVAVTFDPQVSDAVVKRTLHPEQQCRVLGGIVRFLAAREVVGTRPHHGVTRVEQSCASSSRSGVVATSAVKAECPQVRRRQSFTSVRYRTWCRGGGLHTLRKLASGPGGADRKLAGGPCRAWRSPPGSWTSCGPGNANLGSPSCLGATSPVGGRGRAKDWGRCGRQAGSQRRNGGDSDGSMTRTPSRPGGCVGSWCWAAVLS